MSDFCFYFFLFNQYSRNETGQNFFFKICSIFSCADPFGVIYAMCTDVTLKSCRLTCRDSFISHTNQVVENEKNKILKKNFT
jgi:hypothetical protein